MLGRKYRTLGSSLEVFAFKIILEFPWTISLTVESGPRGLERRMAWAIALRSYRARTWSLGGEGGDPRCQASPCVRPRYFMLGVKQAIARVKQS